jgi:hypothetical protein
MNLVKYAWVLLYLLGAFLDYVSRPNVFVGSMVAVLPAFLIGLVVAGIVYFAFKRKKWLWFHVLNTATAVMVGWIVLALVFAGIMATL